MNPMCHDITHPMVMNYMSALEGIPLMPQRIEGNRPLTLLVGAGDIVHSGVTNVEQCSSYDILLCLPSNAEWFAQNVAMLNEESGPIICCLDVNSPKALNYFIEQFRGRFATIDGHWAHIPHFSLETLEQLLCEGGSASNIFELSSGIVNINTFLRWLQEEYINAYSNIHMSTTKVISDGAMNLLDDDCKRLEAVLREKIMYMNSTNKNIHLADDVLAGIPTYRHSLLQRIFGSLLHDTITPLSLLGSVCTHCPTWSREERIELVLRKSTPSFWENMLESYKAIYGNNEVVDRAEKIMAGIRSDMSQYLIWQSKAKYATYIRHMRKNVAPFINANPMV